MGTSISTEQDVDYLIHVGYPPSYLAKPIKEVSQNLALSSSYSPHRMPSLVYEDFPSGYLSSSMDFGQKSQSSLMNHLGFPEEVEHNIKMLEVRAVSSDSFEVSRLLLDSQGQPLLSSSTSMDPFISSSIRNNRIDLLQPTGRRTSLPHLTGDAHHQGSPFGGSRHSYHSFQIHQAPSSSVLHPTQLLNRSERTVGSGDMSLRPSRLSSPAPFLNTADFHLERHTRKSTSSATACASTSRYNMIDSLNNEWASLSNSLQRLQRRQSLYRQSDSSPVASSSYRPVHLAKPSSSSSEPSSLQIAKVAESAGGGQLLLGRGFNHYLIQRVFSNGVGMDRCLSVATNKAPHHSSQHLLPEWMSSTSCLVALHIVRHRGLRRARPAERNFTTLTRAMQWGECAASQYTPRGLAEPVNVEMANNSFDPQPLLEDSFEAFVYCFHGVESTPLCYAIATLQAYQLECNVCNDPLLLRNLFYNQMTTGKPCQCDPFLPASLYKHSVKNAQRLYNEIRLVREVSTSNKAHNQPLPNEDEEAKEQDKEWNKQRHRTSPMESSWTTYHQTQLTQPCELSDAHHELVLDPVDSFFKTSEETLTSSVDNSEAYSSDVTSKLTHQPVHTTSTEGVSHYLQTCHKTRPGLPKLVLAESSRDHCEQEDAVRPSTIIPCRNQQQQTFSQNGFSTGTTHSGVEDFFTDDRAARLRASAPIATEIEPHLFVGGEIAAADCNQLLEKGITHIVNCAAVVIPNHFPELFEYLPLYLSDFSEEPIMHLFELVLQFIEDARRARQLVLIHCHQGVSRSCTFIIAYVMWKRGICYDPAYAYVRNRRTVCSPNSGFLYALFQWQKHLQTPDEVSVFRFLPYSAEYVTPWCFQRVSLFPEKENRLILDPRICYLMVVLEENDNNELQNDSFAHELTIQCLFAVGHGADAYLVQEASAHAVTLLQYSYCYQSFPPSMDARGRRIRYPKAVAPPFVPSFQFRKRRNHSDPSWRQLPVLRLGSNETDLIHPHRKWLRSVRQYVLERVLGEFDSVLLQTAEEESKHPSSLLVMKRDPVISGQLVKGLPFVECSVNQRRQQVERMEYQSQNRQRMLAEWSLDNGATGDADPNAKGFTGSHQCRRKPEWIQHSSSSSDVGGFGSPSGDYANGSDGVCSFPREECPRVIVLDLDDWLTDITEEVFELDDLSSDGLYVILCWKPHRQLFLWMGQTSFMTPREALDLLVKTWEADTVAYLNGFALEHVRTVQEAHEPEELLEVFF